MNMSSAEGAYLTMTVVLSLITLSQYILPEVYCNRIDRGFRRGCVFPCRYAHKKFNPLPSPFHELRVWIFIALQAFWALWLVEQYKKTKTYALKLYSNSSSVNLDSDIVFDTGEGLPVLENGIEMTLRSFIPNIETSFLFEFQKDGLTNAVGILEVTLAFAISLSMNSALSKHSTSIKLFNAFTGDIVAFAMELIAFLEEKKLFEAKLTDKTIKLKGEKASSLGEKTYENPSIRVQPEKLNPGSAYVDTTMVNLKRLFQTLFALPNVTKHEFRGDLRWNEIMTFNEVYSDQPKVRKFKTLTLFKSEAGAHIKKFIEDSKKLQIDDTPTPGLSDTMVLMLKILDYVGDLCDRERRQRLAQSEDKFDIGDPTRKTLKAAWRRIHASYGDMETTVTYTNPSVIKTSVEFGLLLSIYLLPLSSQLYAMGTNCAWICCVVQFFIVGIYFSSVRVRNVYLSTNESFGFRNVTPTVVQTQRSLVELWVSLEDIAKIDGEFVRLNFQNTQNLKNVSGEAVKKKRGADERENDERRAASQPFSFGNPTPNGRRILNVRRNRNRGTDIESKRNYIEHTILKY